ncbi:MAG: HIT domain-containing protein [Candidatus Lokiarchaeota archaeon]|nr:HIT domain-containing protein [Candidatus Lokiarchaeota archaeon]
MYIKKNHLWIIMNKKDGLFEKHLRARNKLDYVLGKTRPEVDCILCSIVEGDPLVKNYIIHIDEIAVVSLNLYPYNPAQLLIFPIRHITDFRELNDNEILHISHLIKKSQDMITELYDPRGFNLGLNQGDCAGASIEHLHYHLVPRFKNELGYIDIIGKSRVIVEDINSIYEKLKQIAPKYFKKEQI